MSAAVVEEVEFVEADVDRERRIRRIIERCIAPGSSVGPGYSLLSVRDAEWLLRQWDRARLPEVAFK